VKLLRAPMSPVQYATYKENYNGLMTSNIRSIINIVFPEGIYTDIEKTINNKGRQTTPFISPDGTYLFFSSDAHLGMGGYDIFVSKLHGSQWSIPINLGFGINSVNDDTHFKYYPELKLGVFASVENDGSRATYNLFTVNMANFDLGSLPFEWE
jgi:Tol biopolymer transport system component